MMKQKVSLVAFATTVAAFAGIDLAPIGTATDRAPAAIDVGLECIGRIRPRAANEIHGSNWMLGCECLDRDFADFDAYKDYIVPLGIKQIRLLAGWAKCERKPGVFDFAWLDHCVDWAVTNGISVYLDLSYGNPLYPGAGGAGLADGIPSTEEGLSHWDVWVETLALHYRGRIRDFAMWNEPDIGGSGNSPEKVAAFNVRTAKILKRVIPDCRLYGLSLAHNDAGTFEMHLKPLGADVKLFDAFTYHGYAMNPDSSYPHVERLKEVLARYAPHAKLVQGENGCISEWSDRFALDNYPWSEISQAKWDMRRMLGDLGHDIRSSVYTICDLSYGGPHSKFAYRNRKGLLRAAPDKTVIQPKAAYFAVQNVVSVFDDTLRRVESPRISTPDRTIALYEYVKDGRFPVFVFWDRGLVAIRLSAPDPLGVKPRTLESVEIPNPRERETATGYFVREHWLGDGIPTDALTTRPAVLDWTGEPLKDPVWVDLLSGRIYEFPRGNQLAHSKGVTFTRVPVCDSPCLLTERAAVMSERDAILSWFDANVYGPPLPKPAGLAFREVEKGEAFAGLAERRQYRVDSTDAKGGHSFTVLVYLPKNGKGKVPGFVYPNFSGNETLADDEKVLPAEDRAFGPDEKRRGRGARADRVAVKRILERGYALVTFCYGEIYPDYTPSGRDAAPDSVYAIFEEDKAGRPPLAHPAWSWGSSRAMDLIETIPEIDAGRVAIVGHSRMGKNAVYTGSHDARFAATIANCGGTKSLKLLPNLFYPHWFAPGLRRYALNGRPGTSLADLRAAAAKMPDPPFDQGNLLGTIAPRALYVAAADADEWSPAEASRQCVEAAEPAFARCGKSIGWHCKRGAHSIVHDDWERFMDWADTALGNGR